MGRAERLRRTLNVHYIWIFRLWFITLIQLHPAQAAEETYPPVASNVSFEEVTALPFRESDYQINYGDNTLQFGRLWLPTSANLGTLIFVHGGCWSNEYGIDHAQALGAALASEGYAVWSLEYRRTGDEGGAWPGAFEDVVVGINKIVDFEDYGLNMKNLTLMGHSAGGHLAVLAGARSELIAVKPNLVVGLAAITDVVSYARGENSCQQATVAFMGGSPAEKPEAFGEAQAVNFDVSSNTVLFYGDVDEIVPSSQSNLPGAVSRLYEGAGHFDWIHPGTGAFREMLSILPKEL